MDNSRPLTAACAILAGMALPDTLADLAAAHGGFTRADAARVGVDLPALRRLVASGDVLRLRRDCYVPALSWAGLEFDQHRLALRTRAQLATRPGDVASHQSALVLHDLPIHGVASDVVDLVADVSRVRKEGALRLHSAAVVAGRFGREVPVTEGTGPLATVPLATGQLATVPSVTVGGLRTVPVAVAVAQVCARSGLLAALVPLDAALHRRLVALDDVAEALAVLPRAAPVRSERLLRLADPLSESPGESLTHELLDRGGHTWRSQVSIYDREGQFVARVDALVDRVVIEFDGAVKYAGADGRDALVAEKQREDRLRALGYAVVRLTWSDLTRPTAFFNRLERALARTSAA